MLNVIAISGAQAKRYYVTFSSATAYYTEQMEGHAYWLGGGAARLALSGPARSEAFANVLDRRMPDGSGPLLRTGDEEKRVRKDGTPYRRRDAWDVTCSAPPHVNALFAAGDEHVRHEVIASQRVAVASMMAHAEHDVLVARAGHAGKDRLPARALAVAVPHETSRNGEGLVHTHVIFVNAGLPADDIWRALESRELYRAQHELGAVYMKALASELERRLGVVTKPIREWFEIEGMPREVVEALTGSRRREVLAASRSDTPRGREIAALATRRPKDSLPELSVLQAEWQSKARALGFDLRQVLHKAHSQNPERTDTLDIQSHEEASRRAAVSRVYESSSDWREGIRRSHQMAPFGKLPAHVYGGVHPLSRGFLALRGHWLRRRQAGYTESFGTWIRQVVSRAEGPRRWLSFKRGRLREAPLTPDEKRATFRVLHPGLTVRRIQVQSEDSARRVAKAAADQANQAATRRLFPINRRLLIVSPHAFMFYQGPATRAWSTDFFLAAAVRPRSHAETLRVMAGKEARPFASLADFIRRRGRDGRPPQFRSLSGFLAYAEQVKGSPRITLQPGTTVLLVQPGRISRKEREQLAELAHRSRLRVVILDVASTSRREPPAPIPPEQTRPQPEPTLQRGR